MATEDLDSDPVQIFNRHAHRYAEKYFDLRDYDKFYERLLAAIVQGGSFVDVACGPGNVSAYVRKHRPDIDVVGVDLAPAMLEEARARVPGARFEMCNCTRLESLERSFDGAAFAFGLSYLDDASAEQCLASLHSVLNAGSTLMLSTMTADAPTQTNETTSSGERLRTFYRTTNQVKAIVEKPGFRSTYMQCIASPSNAPKATRDIVLIATKI